MAKVDPRNMGARGPVFVYKMLRGKVTNAGRGVAIMVDDITPKSGRQLTSSKLTTFEHDADIEAKFRVNGDDFSLVSVSRLDLSVDYQIFVQDVDPSQSFVLLNNVLAHHFGWEQDVCDQVHKAIAENEGNITPISPALHYDDAHHIANQIREHLERQGDDTALVSVLRAVRGAKRNGTAADPLGVSVRKANIIVMAPETVAGHWLSKDEREIFGAIRNRLVRGGHVNVRLSGESGYGKTSKVEALAHYLDLPIEIIDCSTVLDTESWFGYQEARDGSTVFLHTRFTELIRNGNCVILLDEANRVEPQLSNSLFPVLDHRRRTVVHNEEIVVGPSVVIAMTVNTGIKYAGINVQDQALLNRTHGAIEVGPLPQKIERDLLRFHYPDIEENQILEIVAAATELRKTVATHRLDVDVSTRTTLKVAEWIYDGATPDQAWRWSLLNIADEQARKPLNDALNLTRGRRP
jgi:MoxR-like ATPase